MIGRSLHASPGAAGYRLILHDADGEPVWTSPEVRSSQLAAPRELAALLGAGESYYWTVDVLGTGTGERLGPFWFTLGPTAVGADGE